MLPVLAYADPDAAIAWLCPRFRFSEQSRMTGRDGEVRDRRPPHDQAVP